MGSGVSPPSIFISCCWINADRTKSIPDRRVVGNMRGIEMYLVFGAYGLDSEWAVAARCVFPTVRSRHSFYSTP